MNDVLEKEITLWENIVEKEELETRLAVVNMETNLLKEVHLKRQVLFAMKNLKYFLDNKN